MTPRQTPPNSPEAEEAVLGSALINPACFAELRLEPESFFVVRNGWVWSAMQTLHADHQPIDYLTVRDELERQGHLGEAGGSGYLASLLNAVPTALHAPAYARIVRQMHLRRKRLELASQIAQAAYADEDPEAKTSEFVAALTNETASVYETQPLSAVARPYYDELVKRHDNPIKMPGLPTGSRDFDNYTGGLRLKETLLLSGEPGAGKTLLAIQWGLHIAGLGHGVVIYELEMPNERLMDRAVSALAKIPTCQLETGAMGEAQFEAALAAIMRLDGLPVHLDDATGWTTADIRADLVRRINAPGGDGIKLAVVDYLRKVGDEYGSNESEREARISSRLRDTFKDLNLAGLVIHSMNKSGMAATRPGKEHLSGSSQIPYDVDQVVFLMDHTPTNGEAYRNEMRTLMWDKSRNSETPPPVHFVKLPGLPAFGDAEHAQNPGGSNGTGRRASGAGLRHEVEYIDS